MTEPSWRKPAGALAILAWIGLWLAIAASVDAPESRWLQIGWYAVLGLVWIAPLKPVLQWMESGHSGESPED